MAIKNEIQQLYNRYLNNDISEEELSAFLQMLHIPEDEVTVSKLMDGTWKEMFETQEAKVIPLYKRTWYRVAAAAVVLLLLSAGAYFAFFNRQAENPIAKVQPARDIEAPKNSKATITLANGQNVLLNSIANGTLATQGNVKVIKTSDGQIVYNPSLTTPNSPLTYNTLTNPRGSNVVDMTLADGSHVWLNAASSITYPVAFIGNERKVSITGEAYFAVRHNPKMPFKVTVNGTELQDLGTEFNVNGYADEAVVKATLVEGSVRVVNGDNVRLLMPGQQAQISSEGKISLNKNVDIEEVVAWKNGRFQFSNTDIKEIMQQISRWYDVDVVFESNIKNREFTGNIPREVNVSKVLAMLEYAGLQFKIEGKKVTVIK